MWNIITALLVTMTVFCTDHIVRRELAGPFVEFAERFIKLGDYRETTLLVNKRFAKNFSAIALTQGADDILHFPPEHIFHKWPEGRFTIKIPDTNKSLIFWYSFRIAIFFSILINLVFISAISISRKAQERRLTIAAHMERKVEMANLLEQVSHDIRSPLSALNIAVSTLGNIDEHRKAVIITATKRVNDIANSLLARIKNGTGARSLIELNEFIESIVLEKQMETNRKIVVSSQATNPPKIRVNVDSASLARVISNLINNSIQAGADEIELSIQRKGRFICIQVKDDGPGIPTSILKRLGKEPISSGKSGGDGFGLGLWAAYIFAARAGGQLNIESNKKGTTISVSIRS